jgi:hypothetical protein
VSETIARVAIEVDPAAVVLAGTITAHFTTFPSAAPPRAGSGTPRAPGPAVRNTEKDRVEKDG